MEKIKQELKETHRDYKETTEDFKRITKRLVHAIEVAYNRPGVIFWSGVIKGLGQGLGATIGVAIVFIVLTWILRQLGGIPFFAEWVNELSSKIPI